MRGLYKNSFKIIAGFALSLVVAFAAPVSMALAFSGYGAGTSTTSYYISNCSQLEEMSANLSASYELVRNIDCLHTTMSAIGDSTTPFSGTFDGQGFTILNANMIISQNNLGIFGETDNATIKNVNISYPTVEGLNYVGTLVGVATYTTISNVRVDNSLVHGNQNTGGLVGELGGGSINGSSVTNSTLVSNGLAGGLVGYAVGPEDVSDSYSSGTLYGGNGTYIGGLIGKVDTGPAYLGNLYSNVAYYATGNDVGGLMGYTASTATISNSFTVSANQDGEVNSSVGAVFGDSNATTSNIRFDEGLTVYSNCAGTGSPSDCSAVDASGSNTDYFKNTTSVAPLSSWDFTNTWLKNSSGFPSLIPLTNSGVSGAPNNNDANGDGTNDSYEGFVNSVENNSGVWSTVTVPSSSECIVQNPDSMSPTTQDSYSHGLSTLTGFSLYCHTAGASVPVTIIYDKQYNTSNWILRYYDVNTKTYQTVNGAVFGTKTVGGVVKTTVTYTVTDGGAYDSDGVANGIIVDPVVPAITPVAPNTGSGTPARISFIIETLAVLSVVTTGSGLLIARKTFK